MNCHLDVGRGKFKRPGEVRFLSSIHSSSNSTPSGIILLNPFCSIGYRLPDSRLVLCGGVEGGMRPLLVSRDSVSLRT